MDDTQPHCVAGMHVNILFHLSIYDINITWVKYVMFGEPSPEVIEAVRAADRCDALKTKKQVLKDPK